MAFGALEVLDLAYQEGLTFAEFGVLLGSAGIDRPQATHVPIEFLDPRARLRFVFLLEGLYLVDFCKRQSPFLHGPLTECLHSGAVLRPVNFGLVAAPGDVVQLIRDLTLPPA